MFSNPPYSNSLTRECEECTSLFYAPKSPMEKLCPECAHVIHGHSNCNHKIIDGRCESCYWDGSVSDHAKSIPSSKTQMI